MGHRRAAQQTVDAGAVAGRLAQRAIIGGGAGQAHYRGPLPSMRRSRRPCFLENDWAGVQAGRRPRCSARADEH
eukprot:6970162-Lingulodinium_polyedra.AAC.1